MPEGHLIHHYARRHRRLLAGRHVRVSSPQTRFASEAAQLDGRTLRDVDAAGKHLFYVFGDDEQVHVHLGLVGKFVELGADTRSPVSTRLRLAAETVAIHLIAPAECELIDRERRNAIAAALGPDPLDPNADADRVIDALGAAPRPIGALLLDQNLVAGIGNVLRSEILNLAGIDPRRAGSSLARNQLEGVWHTTVDVMTRARRLGSIVTRGNARRQDERSGRFVYKRDTCARCATRVETADVGGRTVYICPKCQR